MASQHPAQKRCAPELRERAVRMVLEGIEAQNGGRYGGRDRAWPASSRGHRVLHSWVRQAEIDSGRRPGTTSEDKAHIAQLKRENRELRRANEILKSAATSFRAELDPRHTK